MSNAAVVVTNPVGWFVGKQWMCCHPKISRYGVGESWLDYSAQVGFAPLILRVGKMTCHTLRLRSKQDRTGHELRKSGPKADLEVGCTTGYDRTMRPVRFLGDLLKCLLDFPEGARLDAGTEYAISKFGKVVAGPRQAEAPVPPSSRATTMAGYTKR